MKPINAIEFRITSRGGQKTTTRLRTAPLTSRLQPYSEQDTQHRKFVEDGIAVSIPTASEGAIYGRFGYGPATTRRSVHIDRQLAAFRPGVSDPVGVRLVDASQAREHALTNGFATDRSPQHGTEF